MTNPLISQQNAAESGDRSRRAAITLICDVRQSTRPWQMVRLEDLSAEGFRITGLNPWRFLLPAVAMAISSSVFEELLFRGVLYRSLETWFGSWVALAVSALVFGLTHLVTARYQRKLADSEARLRASLDHSPSAILVVDEKGRAGFVNRQVEALLGRGPQEVQLRPLPECLGVEPAAIGQPRLREDLRHRRRRVGRQLGSPFRSARRPQARPQPRRRELEGLGRTRQEARIAFARRRRR